jgi:hypothetical protein
MKHVIALLAIVTCTLATCPLFAQPEIPIVRLATKYYRWDTGRMVAQGDLVYLYAAPEGGLRILDLSQGEDPVMVGSWEGIRNTLGPMAISGDYLYVTGPDGLWVLNVSDPNGVEIVSVSGANAGLDIAIKDSVGFIPAYGGGRIFTIDLRDPANPNRFGTIETWLYSFMVEVKVDFLYSIGVSMDEEGSSLSIVDIRDPFNHQFLVEYPMRVILTTVTARDTLVCLGTQRSQLLIVSAADPRNPDWIATCDLPAVPTQIVIQDTVAYVSSERGLHMVNISDPAHPEYIGAYDSTNTLGLEFTDRGRLLAIFFNKGLSVLNIDEPAHPERVGQYNPTGVIYDMTIYGNYGFTSRTMRILDLSNPSDPVEVAQLDTLGRCEEVAIRDDIAYVAADTVLYILDLNDIEHPTLLADLPANMARWVTLAGDYCYVSDTDWGGVRIIDVANPAEPEQIAFLRVQGGSSDIETSGDAVYQIYPGSGVRVVDVSDRRNPVLRSLYQVAGAEAMALDRGYLHVSSRDGMNYILDVSDPLRPVEARRWGLAHDWVNDISISGTLAWMSVHQKGIMVVDITDPLDPYIISSLDTRASPSGVAGADSIVYVGNISNLSVYKLGYPSAVAASPTLPSSFLMLAAFPNPFNSSTTISYTLPKAGWTVVDVMDIQGRLVERLSGGWKAAGRYREVWGGSGVSASSYYLNLRFDNSQAIKRINLIK